MTVTADKRKPVREHILRLLENVCDPEIPSLTIAELGILRDIRIDDLDITVVITPSYSACPAMDTIAADIRAQLAMHGFVNVHIKTQLAPAWTTAEITPAGHEKLRAAGIAPPVCSERATSNLRAREEAIQCPNCGARETEKISEFGATPCKALHRCLRCLEPFEYFKCL